MFVLNEQSKKNISQTTGIAFDDISNMDFEEIDGRVEKKINKKLTYMKVSDSRLLGRGQVYYYLDRMMDMSDVDKQLSRAQTRLKKTDKKIDDRLARVQNSAGDKK